MYLQLIWWEATNTCKVIQELLLHLLCEDEVLPTYRSITVKHLIFVGVCHTVIFSKMYNGALWFLSSVYFFLSSRTDFEHNSTC